MGNSPSVEAPRRSQRTSQKLSKPRTGNAVAAGLLSPSGVSDSAPSSSTARHLSLPHTPSTATSPKFLEADAAVAANVLDGKKEPEPRHRPLRQLFRSNTSRETHGRQQRSNSTGISAPRKGRWSSRANSLGNGPEGGYGYNEPHAQGSSSINASRTSVNYDLASYAAQRLLNLVEEPPHADSPGISENQWQVPEAMPNEFRSRHPSISETSPSMTRVSSELSLYTPMRRRSLMTPGVATRETRTDPTPPMPRIRYSVPSTLAYRESMETMGNGIAGFSPALNPDPIPRALTPCEAEYKQTGAFKLGTLRITNGSPARSPARAPADGSRHEDSKELLVGGTTEEYVGAAQVARRGRSETKSSTSIMEQVDVQNPSSLQSSGAIAFPIKALRGSLLDATVPDFPFQPQASHQCLRKYEPNDILWNDERPEPSQVQATSKHTAAEDKLFDIEQNEYSSVEILDVRIDLSAKSLPPNRKLIPERRKSKEISRSDSGIASPGSESSHVPLSKADSGYSSSVSLRSLSSRPPVPQKDYPSDNEVGIAIGASIEQASCSDESKFVGSPDMALCAVSRTLDDTFPPPVPTKDTHLTILAGPGDTAEISPNSQQNYKAVGTSNSNQVPERVLSPSNSNNRDQVDSIIDPRRASPHPNSTSSLSIIGGAYRKPSKLQRLLSSARSPVVVHNTESTEYAGVPPISTDMQAKLQAHTERLPISYRQLALKSAASKETLGTILSVGSAELLQDEDIPSGSNSSLGQLRAPDRKQATQISSMGSAISRGTSGPFVKKPIIRKPVPVRSIPPSMESGPTKPTEPTKKSSSENVVIQAPFSQNASGADCDINSPAAVTGRTRYSMPPRLARSSTMSEYVQEGIETAYADTRHSSQWVLGKSQSTMSPEFPFTAPNMRLPRNSPPVSMRTRNIGPLRVPPPLRSRSTPPETLRPGRPPYSRWESQDGGLIGAEVTAVDPMTISRRSSRESFCNYTPAQAHYADAYSNAISMNDYQQTSVRPQYRESRAPNWNVQTDHDTSFIRRPPSDHSRRNSLASQSSQRSSTTAGPSFPRQQRSQPDPPILQRRSSYDSYEFVSRDSYIRDNGPYPSISRNGQAYVTDPWSGRSLPQQCGPFVQNALYTPRAHLRHRSLDQYGNHTRYRILHSYNSPAYRNVPIWG
ncbi:hypothetical protein AAE478_008420 [Parahypoxylon ruwenzoriense]